MRTAIGALAALWAGAATTLEARKISQIYQDISAINI